MSNSETKEQGHLILSRKVDQKIIVGDGLLEITVVEIRGDKVRLGFRGDRKLSVHREEVYEAILKEKQNAQ